MPLILVPPRIDWVSLSGWGKLRSTDALQRIIKTSRTEPAVLPFHFTYTTRNGQRLAGTVTRHFGDAGAAVTFAGAQVEVFGGDSAKSRDFAVTITGGSCIALGGDVIGYAARIAQELFPTCVRLTASRLDACCDFLPDTHQQLQEWADRRVAKTSPTFYGKPLETWQEGSRKTGDLLRIYNKTAQYNPASDGNLWAEKVQKPTEAADGPFLPILRLEVESHTEALERLECRDVWGPGVQKPDDAAWSHRLIEAWLVQTSENRTRLWVAADTGPTILRQREVDGQWAKLVNALTMTYAERTALKPCTPSPDHALRELNAKFRRLFAIALIHPDRDPGVTDDAILKACRKMLLEDIDHIVHNPQAVLGDEMAKLCVQLAKLPPF